jgi:hypothetical protein
VITFACSESRTPSSPNGVVGSDASGIHLGHRTAAAALDNPNSAAGDDKGYLDGWFEGETIRLHYTKTFFCAEPPSSGADTNCEIGAGPEIAPRPGPIPTIYAIAAAGGIQPDVSTLACPGGSECLNHPAHIDISRVRPGVFNSPALPHSHVLAERHGGWFNTVNIRVTDLGVWNQIAAAKSLAKVRELQADPEIGGKGLISQDTPTNIFFFIASWHS